MKIEDFKKLPYGHFKPTENWGDIEKVSFDLVVTLDKFRELLGHPVYISPAEGAVYAPGTGHAKNSVHYLGLAADIFPKSSLLQAFIIANQIPEIGGIGVYPYWKWEAKKLYGGLHLDIRKYDKRRSLWWRDKKGNYRGFFTEEDTKDFFDAMYELNEIFRSLS
jgi:hypothetical protein